MANEPDMTAPITRGELHEALETWAGAIIERIMAQLQPTFDRIEGRFAGSDDRFANIDVRLVSLDTRLTSLDTRLTSLDTRLTSVDTRVEEIHGRLVLIESRVGDIPALIQNTEETILGGVQSMLEPQRTVPERVGKLEAAALPERVGKLEAKVFAPKRRASKTSRRRS